MNLIDALKSLPKERIRNDPEFREAYKILKEAIEGGLPNPPSNLHRQEEK